MRFVLLRNETFPFCLTYEDITKYRNDELAVRYVRVVREVYVTVECGYKPSQKSGIMKWAGVGAHAELEITPYHEIHDI